MESPPVFGGRGGGVQENEKNLSLEMALWQPLSIPCLRSPVEKLPQGEYGPTYMASVKTVTDTQILKLDQFN